MLNGFYVAKFEKVSLDQFKKDMNKYVRNNIWTLGIMDYYSMTDKSDETFDRFCELIYEDIKIPARATYQSAGYDFFMPFGMSLPRLESIVIPTGIRCAIVQGHSLDIYPKSGLGFNYNLKICNTIGIIDSDYYHSSNEGHIMVKIENVGFNGTDTDYHVINFAEGKSFVQGIFHEVFQASNDEDNVNMVKRDGGIGSTK